MGSIVVIAKDDATMSIIDGQIAVLALCAAYVDIVGTGGQQYGCQRSDKEQKGEERSHECQISYVNKKDLFTSTAEN